MQVYAFWFIALTLNFAYLRVQIVNGNNNATKVAQYIQHKIGSDALIETYDSELIFLLANPIHYPPDQVQFDLNRRYYLKENLDISYDPSTVNFSYLIDRPYSRMWQLYSPMLEKGHFQLVYGAGEYQI